MRRGLIIAIYALGGLGIALSLSFATFAVAGQDLNDPAYPVRPVAATNGGSASPKPDQGTTAHEGPTHSPHPGTLSPAPTGGSARRRLVGWIVFGGFVALDVHRFPREAGTRIRIEFALPLAGRRQRRRRRRRWRGRRRLIRRPSDPR